MIEAGIDKIRVDIRSGGVTIPAIKNTPPNPKNIYAIVL